MLTPQSCPNCGAPITGWRCEYCGTVFEREPASVRLSLELCKQQIERDLRTHMQIEEASRVIRAIRPWGS